jgi:hypothetical protein
VRTATGSVKLVASLEGHESARENVGVEPGGQVFVELELQALDGVVAGEVRLGDGTPVQDVAVGAKAESLFGRSDVWVEQTDADGRFAIHVPAARGTFRVYTMLDRRQKDTWTATPEAYEDVAPESEDVVFTLALREQITGWVVDEQERPVRDFELQLFNDVLGRYRFARFVESEDGSFVMPFDAEEDLFLKVVAAGHEPFEIWDLERQADVKLIVRLRSQLLELAGRVLDAEGRPVPGARVMRSNYDRDAAFPPGSRYSPVSVTDAEGRFLLNGIAAANEATLLVSGPQPSSPPLVRFALAGAERAGDEVVLRLPQVAPTVLHLRSAGGGAPRGLYTITSEDGFPLDPRLEQVLEHEAGDALPALDELGPGGELRIVLPAGPHRFVYRATGAGMDDIQVYEFVVSLSEPNEFTFLLVGS